MRTISSRAPSTRQVSAAGALRRAATSLAARARAERRGELSLNQTAVLGRLVMAGPITPGEVASQLHMLPQSLTRTFAALDEAGYLHRTPDPADGRQSLLAINEAGLRALRAEMAPRDAWVARAMAQLLTPDEQAQLAAAAPLMERLIDFESGVAPREPA